MFTLPALSVTCVAPATSAVPVATYSSHTLSDLITQVSHLLERGREEHDAEDIEEYAIPGSRPWRIW